MTNIQKLAIVYGFGSLLFFLFAATPQDYLFENISVPFLSLDTNIGITHAVATVLILIMMLVETKASGFKFDLIALLLFMRVVFYLLAALFFKNALDSIGSLIIPVSTLMSYLICANSNLKSKKLIVLMYAVLVVILGAQLLYTIPRISSMPGYYQAAYALYVKVPIGSSNVIAGYLVPALLMVIVGLTGRPRLQVLVCALGLYLVHLTTSTAAWLFLAAGFFIWIATNLGLRSRKNILLLLLIFVALAGIALALASSSVDIASLTHGRAAYWAELFWRSFESPLLGHGFGYSEHEQAHSIIFDTLYEGGIIGLIIYIVAVALVLKKAYSIPNGKCIAIFLTILFFFQCEETCYFDYRGDIIFWMTAGFAVSLADVSPHSSFAVQGVSALSSRVAHNSVVRKNYE